MSFTSKSWNLLTATIAAAAWTLMAPFGSAIDYANIDVVDGAAPTNTTTPAVSMPPGQFTTAGANSEGFFIDPGYVVGETPIRIGVTAANDRANGVLIVSARETGRFPVDGPSTTIPLSPSVASVTDDDTTSLNTRNVSGGLAIVTRRSGSNISSAAYPAGSSSAVSGVMNANVAAAYFPYSQGWQGGVATASINESTIDTFVVSPGITFSPIVGPANTTNVRPSYFGNGMSFVSIPGVTDSRQQGILLSTAAKNEDNFGLSSATREGDGWNVMVKSNAVNGVNVAEADPFSFVFLPLGTPNVTMGVLWGNGGQAGNPIPVLKSGANFTVTRDATVPGNFHLNISGFTPADGVLLVGGESNLNGAGSGLPGDNLVTVRPDGNEWIIVSDDLDVADPNTGQFGQDTEPLPYFHFAFLPFNAPPTGPGTIPAPKWTKSSVFAFSANVTEIDARGNNNNDFIQASPPADPGVPGPDVYHTISAGTPGMNFVATNSNKGDQQTHVNGALPTLADGIMFATISEGLRNNSTGGDGGPEDYGIVSVHPSSSQWKVSTSGAGSQLGEMNLNYSVAFFGANSGFTMANVAADTTGLASVTISGVNSNIDGVLMANASSTTTSVSNLEDNFVVMNPKLDGSGWDVQNWDNGLFAQTTTSVNYIYLPYTAQNLVAGSVNPDGTLKSSTPASGFTLTREASGSYLLHIEGKTPNDGMLLLVAGNNDANSQDNNMVYEAAGSDFRILGVDLITNAEGEGGFFTTLEDSAFQFAYIDYTTPPSLGGNFLAADFNHSGGVTSADLPLWRQNFGTNSGATNAMGDADGDGDVDGADVITWQRQLGSMQSAVVAGGAVPEPSTLVLALAVATGLCSFGRKQKIST
jgi:hypothetical protein